MTSVRKKLAKKTDWKNDLISCYYRPFDKRFCYFNKLIVDRPRTDLLNHVAKKANLCLGIGRQGMAVNDDIWNLVTVSNLPIDKNVFRRGGVDVAPLYLYPTEKQTLFDEERSGKEPNFSKEFIVGLISKLRESFKTTNMDDLPKKNYPHFTSTDSLSISPEDMFYYIYAIFHSPTYRSRYAEFLKIDFPRVPITSSYPLFWTLARLGEKLVDLHLLEKDIETDVIFPVKGSNLVEFVKYKGGNPTVMEGAKDDTLTDVRVSAKFGKVYINKSQYFENVPENAWNFHIGGYQVLHKWLKDRKDRELSFDDLEHYEQVVSALMQTIELMQNIDETFEENGGFPIE
ncbi:MAG: type ISP restriction/modification enzyme [Aridibacter sp.]